MLAVLVQPLHSSQPIQACQNQVSMHIIPFAIYHHQLCDQYHTLLLPYRTVLLPYHTFFLVYHGKFAYIAEKTRYSMTQEQVKASQKAI